MGRIWETVAPAIAGVGLIAAVACGDGDGGSDGPFTEEEARAAAETAVITPADFPQGWFNAPPIDFGDDPFGLNLSEECQLFMDIHLSSADRGVAEAWSDAFASELGGIASSATVYATDEEARDFIRKVRDLVNVCREPLKEAFGRLSELAQGGTVTVTKFDFAELSFASFGDESVAIRMIFSATGPDSDELVEDITVLRVGNVTGLLDYSSDSDREPDRALQEHLMGVIEERVREAAASLE